MKRIFLSLFAAIALLASCDNTTDGIGASLVGAADKLDVASCTFGVSTESVVADSVISRSTTGYLGKVKDPVTGSYLTCNLMTQLHTLDSRAELFPSKEEIAKKNGKLTADSCNIVISYKSFYGDGLSLMKCVVHELDHAVEEGKPYYSSFSAKDNGFIRKDGIHQEFVYTLEDQSTVQNSQFVPAFKVSLDVPYKSKDGKSYKHYGEYILDQYYANPDNFSSQYKFVHNVCPGFYIESTNGVGSMAYVYISQLNVRCTYSYDTDSIGADGQAVRDTISNTVNFCGTEEVLQLTNTIQDAAQIKALASETDHTYLKTPAGIYTSVEIPVDSIMRDYTSTAYKLRDDTLNVATMTIKCLSEDADVQYKLSKPATLLMVRDTLKSEFFEKSMISDGSKSSLISYSSSENGYVFSNISSLIISLARDKYDYIQSHSGMTSDEYDKLFPNWNKFALIPVNASYTSVGSASLLTRVVNDMSLSSVKLEGGLANPKSIKLKVVYSKFNTK